MAHATPRFTPGKQPFGPNPTAKWCKMQVLFLKKADKPKGVKV